QDLFYQFISVHIRQIDINQHKIDVLLFQKTETFCCIESSMDFICTSIFQQVLPIHLPYPEIIFNYKNLHYPLPPSRVNGISMVNMVSPSRELTSIYPPNSSTLLLTL